MATPPQQLRHAYGFDQLGATGQGQTIAIVDAYGSPTIQADLNTFCTAFGIPSTTIGVYYPQGQPAANSSWSTEISLDVEWAHAIAPGATIALIVAKSSSTADLYGAIDYAVSIGATQVSMSWGGPEYSTEETSDFHFNVPGVTFVASSGDSGAYTSQTSNVIGVSYPACSPYVVGVGGTTLNLDSSGNILSETAWSYNQSNPGTGSGGGISAYETVPSYQAGRWSGATRGVPDVAYDANPGTGVPVYLTGSGWRQIGGTSMGAPQWAALSALANSLRSQSINTAPGIFYSLANANYAGCYHDIISGSNGAYSAGPGYDLVTGLGSPIANQIVLALSGAPSQAAAPVFSPAPGAYLNAQNVTITTITPGATIRYTTDGTTPSETNGTIYSGLVNIASTTTLQAIAYESGFTDSAVASGTYIIGSLQAAAPTFSPSPGIFISSVTVTISTTSGPWIRYTTDGSAPSETNGTLYSGPVKINTTTTLQAIAYGAGFVDSTVTSGNYAIYPPTQPPVFNPPAGNYPSPQTVTITSATSGASIRYTTDGSTPKYNSGILYSGPVPINVTTTLKAVAYYNYTSVIVVSQVTTGIYTITVPAATPIFNPAPGTYTTAQSVTITTTTTGASIRYTTDGSTPTETNGTLYSAPVNISATTTLQAIAYASGFTDSTVTSGTYTILLPAAAPVFSPAPGTYTSPQMVTITSATAGASLRYTTDGSTPTETNGTLYTVPVTISTTTTLQAIAYAGGFTDSSVTSGAYTIILPAAAPVFSPADGTYTSTQYVTMTSATSGASIRYTTDGSTPTETNGTIYSGPVTISATTTLQAIAYASGLTDSAVTSGTYTISHPVPGWALRDFNGDGQPDILWHNATTGDVAVWTLNGTAVTGATFIANIGAPWSIVAVGDFNQDNNADILWRNATTGEICVTLMNRTAITSYVGLGILDSSWTVAGLGDFNGDGQTDILLQNTSTGEVGFWSLNGTTVTGFTPIGTIPSPWTIAGVGDFNGDGKADLLWYNSTTGDMIVSLMNGASATGYQAVGNLPLPWTVAGLADFNGDGSVDILLRNATTGDIGLFLMNGTTPTSFVLLGNVPSPWQPSD